MTIYQEEKIWEEIQKVRTAQAGSDLNLLNDPEEVRKMIRSTNRKYPPCLSTPISYHHEEIGKKSIKPLHAVQLAFLANDPESCLQYINDEDAKQLSKYMGPKYWSTFNKYRLITIEKAKEAKDVQDKAAAEKVVAQQAADAQKEQRKKNAVGAFQAGVKATENNAANGPVGDSSQQKKVTFLKQTPFAEGNNAEAGKNDEVIDVDSQSVEGDNVEDAEDLMAVLGGGDFVEDSENGDAQPGVDEREPSSPVSSKGRGGQDDDEEQEPSSPVLSGGGFESGGEYNEAQHRDEDSEGEDSEDEAFTQVHTDDRLGGEIKPENDNEVDMDIYEKDDEVQFDLVDYVNKFIKEFEEAAHKAEYSVEFLENAVSQSAKEQIIDNEKLGVLQRAEEVIRREAQDLCNSQHSFSRLLQNLLSEQIGLCGEDVDNITAYQAQIECLENERDEEKKLNSRLQEQIERLKKQLEEKKAEDKSKREAEKAKRQAMAAEKVTAHKNQEMFESFIKKHEAFADLNERGKKNKGLRIDFANEIEAGTNMSGEQLFDKAVNFLFERVDTSLFDETMGQDLQSAFFKYAAEKLVANCMAAWGKDLLVKKGHVVSDWRKKSGTTVAGSVNKRPAASDNAEASDEETVEPDTKKRCVDQ